MSVLGFLSIVFLSIATVVNTIHIGLMRRKLQKLEDQRRFDGVMLSALPNR